MNHETYKNMVSLVKLAGKSHCECIVCDTILKAAELARSMGWSE